MNSVTGAGTIFAVLSLTQVSMGHAAASHTFAAIAIVLAILGMLPERLGGGQ